MDTAPFVDPGKQEIPFRGGVAAGTEDVTHPQTVATEVESVTETVVERVPETAVETPVVVKEPATDPVETPQVLTPSVNLPPRPRMWYERRRSRRSLSDRPGQPTT